MEVSFQNSKLWSKRQFFLKALVPLGLHVLLFLLFTGIFILLFFTLSQFGRYSNGYLKHDEHELSRSKSDGLFTLGSYKTSINILNQYAAKNNESNILLSPLSLLLSISMLLDSALDKGMIKDVKRVIGWKMDSEDEFHRSIGDIWANLECKDNGTCLEIKTALFLNKNVILNQDYLKTLNEVYKTVVQKVDFNDTNKTKKAVENWLEGSGQQLSGTVNTVGGDLAILTSNVNFKGLWLSPFYPLATEDREFHTASGNIKKVTMMYQTGNVGFGLVNGVTVLRMPYLGGKTSMYFLLSAEGRCTKWIRSKILKDVKTYIVDIDQYLDIKEVDICMPKIKFEQSGSLRTLLSAAGMRDLFSGGLMYHVSDLLEQVTLLVDEAGTEASSATFSILSDRKSAEQFCATSPFVFFIRDNLHKTLLFLGQYTGK